MATGLEPGSATDCQVAPAMSLTLSEPSCVLMALLCSPGARFPGEGPAQPWLGEGGTCLQVLQ